MKRAPHLDSYMPLSTPVGGQVDEVLEGLARKHVEVYRRKKSRAASPVLVERDVNRPVLERVERWEAEKATFATDLQYAHARIAYLEDLVRLQRDTVERPLRRKVADLQLRVDAFQNQLNTVANQMEAKERALNQAVDELAAAAHAKDRAAEEERRERQRLVAHHEEHLRAERDLSRVTIEKKAAELETLRRDLEASLSQREASSPVNSWGGGGTRVREESQHLEHVAASLSAALEAKDREIDSLTDRINTLVEGTTVENGSAEHASFTAVWTTLETLLTDTERHKAGLATAASQLALRNVSFPVKKTKPPPPMPPPFSTLAAWGKAMEDVASLASGVSADGRSYSVHVLKKVITSHEAALEAAAEKERAASVAKGLDRQRLAEVERDRDEERKLFSREREKLRAEAGSLKKNFQDLQQKAMRPHYSLVEAFAQTDSSLGSISNSYTQTAWDAQTAGHLPQHADFNAKQLTIQDLTRSIEQRDHDIRRMREQRERFLSFVFEPAQKLAPLPSSAQAASSPVPANRPSPTAEDAAAQHIHTSPRRASALTQLSAMDFLGS